MRSTGQSSPKLYNLEEDIGESTNVLSDHPEVAALPKASADDFERDLGENIRPVGIAENPNALSK